jgi:hypothetical protein
VCLASAANASFYRAYPRFYSLDGDQLWYEGETVSPRSWVFMVTGTVRNPGRDIWIRRGIAGAGRAFLLRPRDPARRQHAVVGAGLGKSNGPGAWSVRSRLKRDFLDKLRGFVHI